MWPTLRPPFFRFNVLASLDLNVGVPEGLALSSLQFPVFWSHLHSFCGFEDPKILMTCSRRTLVLTSSQNSAYIHTSPAVCSPSPPGWQTSWIKHVPNTTPALFPKTCPPQSFSFHHPPRGSYWNLGVILRSYLLSPLCPVQWKVLPLLLGNLGHPISATMITHTKPCYFFPRWMRLSSLSQTPCPPDFPEKEKSLKRWFSLLPSWL